MSVVETTTQTTPTTNGISIHQDASAAQKELGSPTTELPLLNITPQRTPAKNMIKNEFAHMRSTSNKENMVPGSPLMAAPVTSSQTSLAPGRPEVQTPLQIQPQSADEQKKDDEQKDGEASETTQAEDGQDDSLVGHFEALSVSPKKHKFIEQEALPDAEQLALDQPTLEQPVDQNEKQETDTTKPAAATSQDKEKKVSASPLTKKSSSTSSQTDTPKLARKPSVRQSTLGRQSSVIRKSMAPPSRPEPSTTSAIKRTTSIKRSSVRPSIAPRPGSSNSTERTAHPPANIPHSKPRPMSMSFPTPPPPPKSTKAATQATFQLPGEAIAAKLKVDKEARLLRQAESGGMQKSTYKPPTMQKSTKAPTKATFQLPGEAIAAKLKQEKADRLKRQEENGGGGGAAASKPSYVPPVVQKSTKPVTKATFQLSSDIFAAKMKAQKEAKLAKQKEEEEKREKERGVFKARPAPKTSKPAEVRQTTASRARLPSTETSALGRASSVRDSTTTVASKRLSSFHPSVSTTTTLPPRATTSFQKRQSIAAPLASTTVSKGKQVFSRAKEGKEKEEKEKKEKEEAAKKARSEAAEAGRLKSREWAEKKKREERRKTAAAAVV
jgi:hypothetical protein